MSLAEKINQHVKELPEPLQAEVLDFVEFIEAKSVRNGEAKREWSKFSLSSAIRGMEEDASPYTLKDIKEPIS